MSTKTSAVVRMYRFNELGDCFLVTFTTGKHASRILIDCGSFRNTGESVSQLKRIARDIRKTLDGVPLDVVVGTHQHNDHLSGFVHCEKIFRSIGVKQVWLSWLDDPRDRMARGIGEAHHKLKLVLYEAAKRLKARPDGTKGSKSLGVLNDVLGFYGAMGAASGPPQLPAEAVEKLKQLGEPPPRYLRPGNILDLPGLPKGSVKVYVLGPPRDSDLLYRKDPRTGESYDHALSSAVLGATKFLGAASNRAGETSSEERHYPFSDDIFKRRAPAWRSQPLKKVIDRYRHEDNSWRTIDDDWMSEAETLALYLDTFTNNSSLVLAIELADTGRVLLFAADAQTGNWSSWPTVKWDVAGISTDDLLARTVFYKVGHHGSHNATLVATFEKMSHPDLAALIPVHKKDPNITKPNGWKMPATNLFKRLREKTSNRVLQMDGVNPPECDPAKAPAATAWKKIGIKPKQTDFFIELEFSGK